MRIPTIRGIIDRRILVSYRIAPDAMRAVLPAPFRPKIINGHAIGGICLIRLKQVRPALLPLPVGLSSENGAHRIAVEWDDADGTREGVYIPRRDTNSRLTYAAGGRLFPGVHHHATFTVRESADHYFVELTSDDGETRVRVDGRTTTDWPAGSTFASLDDASSFFEAGALGYSATRTPGKYDGLELACDTWHCDALAVEDVHSSYFENKTRFPTGTVEFDCALLMRGIHHEWHSRDELCCLSDR
jgi:hypothetical protein